MSHSQRTAAPARCRLLHLVVGQGAKFALLGLVLSIICALAFARLMPSLLYGVSSRDPLTFLVVSLLCLLAALAAAYIPGRMAMRVDPAIALRQE